MAIKFDMHSHFRVHTEVSGFEFVGLGGLVEDGWRERLRERISNESKIIQRCSDNVARTTFSPLPVVPWAVNHPHLVDHKL